MDALLKELAAITGPEHVLTDPDLTAGYVTDWTRRFRGTARWVVRPGATAEGGRGAGCRPSGPTWTASWPRRAPGPSWFGHIGLGNLHVNVLGPDPDDDRVDQAVLRLAAEHGGTISAAHGIGRAKTAVLYLSRSAVEIAVMRAVKSALDPAGILNPDVLFPPGTG